MSAYNVVRFRIKPGQEDAFLEAHRRAERGAMKGLRKASLIKTGEHNYCFVGEWDDYDSIAAARPQMIAILDSFRATLEDLGGGLGLTDPVSGPTVVELK